MTYDELVTAIRNYTEVGDNVFTNSVINTFITFAENQILREIDLDVFKVEASATMTLGNKFLTAPSSILTHRYMMITSNGDQVFLDFRDTSFMKEYWPDGTATGVPKYYSVWDQNTFYIAPTPNAAFSVELGYIYRPTQLSSTNPTTWISDNAPEALFYACMMQAYSYTKGPEGMLGYFKTAYREALQGLGMEQQGRRRRDEYRDGMVRVPIKSGVSWAMISVQSPVLLSGVQVATTSNRGWSVEELAQRAADKIVHVGDRSHPVIREQAMAFKDSVKQVVASYLKEAIEQDRATIANKLSQAGYPDLRSILGN